MCKNHLLFAALFVRAISANAATTNTLTVTSAADSGAGTLRAAITQINAASANAADDAAAVHIITFAADAFPPNVETTISLASALPAITQTNVTIRGHFRTSAGLPRAAIRIEPDSAASAEHPFRVLHHAAAGHFTLDSIAIASGRADNANGGGVLSAGNATIRRCVFRGNTASNGVGGAVHVATGRAIIIDSIFAGNAASSGAAVHADTIAAMNSIFLGNNTANPLSGAAHAVIAASFWHAMIAGNNGNGAHAHSPGSFYAYNCLIFGNTNTQIIDAEGEPITALIGGHGTSRLQDSHVNDESNIKTAALTPKTIGGTPASFIDGGIPAILALLATDLEGAPRPLDGEVAFGAFENSTQW